VTGGQTPALFRQRLARWLVDVALEATVEEGAAFESGACAPVNGRPTTNNSGARKARPGRAAKTKHPRTNPEGS
jgi:hypothetical protein